MNLKIERKLFKDKSEAIAHANALDLWPIAQILEEEESEELHWHRWDTHIYVVSGWFKSIDPESNRELLLEQGDYMVMPKNKLHAMNCAKGTVVIYATKDPINFSKPVNLPPEELVESNV